MRKLIWLALLLVGCAGQYDAKVDLSTYVDSVHHVVCYKVPGSSPLSCVHIPPDQWQR